MLHGHVPKIFRVRGNVATGSKIWTNHMAHKLDLSVHDAWENVGYE